MICPRCSASIISSSRLPVKQLSLIQRYKSTAVNANANASSRQDTSNVAFADEETYNWRNDRTLPAWQRHKLSLKEKFEGAEWRPKRRVSREAMEGIRLLHRDFPDTFTTQRLGEEFQIGPEAVRRILKSKWVPSTTKRRPKSQAWRKTEHEPRGSVEQQDPISEDSADEPRTFNMKRITLADLKE